MSVLPPPNGGSLRDPHLPADTPLLYTVTRMARSRAAGGQSTPIICTSLERALEHVQMNLGDLHEGGYETVVIETVVPDELYSLSAREQWWFTWTGDTETGRYTPSPPPTRYARTIGFGIG